MCIQCKLLIDNQVKTKETLKIKKKPKQTIKKKNTAIVEKTCSETNPTIK